MDGVRRGAERSPRPLGSLSVLFSSADTVPEPRLVVVPWLPGVTPRPRLPRAGLAKSRGGGEDVADARPGRGRAAAPALCAGSAVTQALEAACCNGAGTVRRAGRAARGAEPCGAEPCGDAGATPGTAAQSLDPRGLETTAEPSSCPQPRAGPPPRGWVSPASPSRCCPVPLSIPSASRG